MSKKVVYALRQAEQEYYLRDLLNKRDKAFFILREMLEERQPDEWVTFYSLLCEYIGVLYHLGTVLEDLELSCDWDEKIKQWIMDPKLAMKVSVYLTSERTCHRELLFHNTSLSLH